LRAASQIATEYNRLARRDSTALNLSATLTALAIEEGQAVEQVGAIEVIKEKVIRRLENRTKNRPGSYRRRTVPKEAE